MQRIRLLIVDDDPSVIEDLPDLFKTYDIDAEAETLLSDVSTRATSGAFDCIVLDIKMPPPPTLTDEETDCGRLTGVVICAQIRKADAELPIVVYTSVTDAEAHRKIREAGANDIAVKPIYFDALVQRVRAAVKAAGRTVGSTSDFPGVNRADESSTNR